MGCLTLLHLPLDTTLQITRDAELISEPEWRVAVRNVKGLRLGGPPVELRDPESGRLLRVPVLASDVQIRLYGSWVPVFRYMNGRVSFDEIPGVEQEQHPVRLAALRLARELKAEVRRVSGELLPW